MKLDSKVDETFRLLNVDPLAMQPGRSGTFALKPVLVLEIKTGYLLIFRATSG